MKFSRLCRLIQEASGSDFPAYLSIGHGKSGIPWVFYNEDLLTEPQAYKKYEAYRKAAENRIKKWGGDRTMAFHPWVVSLTGKRPIISGRIDPGKKSISFHPMYGIENDEIEYAISLLKMDYPGYKIFRY